MQKNIRKGKYKKKENRSEYSSLLFKLKLLLKMIKAIDWKFSRIEAERLAIDLMNSIEYL